MFALLEDLETACEKETKVANDLLCNTVKAIMKCDDHL